MSNSNFFIDSLKLTERPSQILFNELLIKFNEKITK